MPDPVTNCLRTAPEFSPCDGAFRQLAENSPDSIIRYDRNGRILYLNRKQARDLGVPPAELIGKTTAEAWPDGRFATIEQAVLHAARTGEDANVELDHEVATGGWIYSEVRVVAERDKRGKIVGALAFGREISTIRETERRLRHFIEELPGMACVLRRSPEGRDSLPYVCPSIETFFNLEAEEVREDATPFYDLAHPDDRPLIGAALAESTQALEPFHLEFRLQGPNGAERWVEMRATPAREADGALLWYGILLDITERKRMEVELERREREFRTLAENIPDPIFRYDREGRRIYANAAAARIAGRPAGALLGGTPRDGALLAPDEARRLARAIREVVQSGNEGRLDLHISDADGSRQEFDALLAPELSMDGLVATVLCISRNITVLRQAEQQAARFFANMPGFAFSFHMPLQGPPCFPFASPGIERIYGLRPDEVRDDMAPLHALAHPDDRPRIEAALGEAARTLAPFRIEVRIRPPGRPERWIECRSVPERQADGSSLWHGIMLDITERKVALQRMELLERAIDQSREAFFLNDQDLHFVEVNDAACRSLGYRREELLELTPPDIDPDITPKACRALMRGSSDVPQTVVTRHRTKDGRVFPVEMSASVFLHDGVRYGLAMVRDISERKELLDRLERSERDFRSLAENLPDNVVRWDAQGRFLYVNPANERAVGIRSEEVAGLRISEVFPPALVAEFEAAIRRVAASGEPELLAGETVREASGEERLHDVKLVPEFGPDGTIVSVLGLGRDMTELYRLQKAVCAREQAFRSLAESSPEHIIRADLDHRIRYMNQKLMRLLGLDSVEDGIGRRSDELWPDGRYAALREAAVRAMENGEPQTLDLIAPGEEGKRYHQIIVVPERDVDGAIIGTLAFGRDVTAIRETERRLHHFIDTLPGLAFAFRLTPDGRRSFPFASSGILDLYGLTPQAVQDDAAPLLDLIHLDDRPRIEAAFAESAQTLGPLRIEFRIRRPGLQESWVEWRGLPDLQLDGSILWHGIVLDISERKRAEATARAHLEESSRLQRLQTAGELATLLAHEINQPLAAIATYAEACLLQLRKSGPNRGRLAANLERIGQQAIRAGDSIRQMRRFIRRGRIDPAPVSLSTVIHRACDLQCSNARGSSIRLEIELDEGLPPVLGVEVQVEQVLLNLLRNAHDAVRDSSKEGGIIQVRGKRVGTMVQVTVHDSGPGIDTRTVDLLFEPFASTKAEGLGMGLRISRGLIEAHGGRLWVEPRTPGGCFHFTLPISQ